MNAPVDRTISSVVTNLPWGDEYIDQLRAAFHPAVLHHVHPYDAAGLRERLDEAQVALLFSDITDDVLAAPRLRWVHCDHAGLSNSATPEVFARGLVVTGSAGRSAEALAQHGFYFALALTFGARQLFQMQDAHVWHGIPNYHERFALWGKTLGVVGYGHTGRAIGELGKAFGMRVIGYRRGISETPPEVDLMLCADRGESLQPLLEEADVVMLALSLTDDTHHLFGAEEFALMKSDALLINLARGGIVDQDALISALETGEIGGAGLDVTTPEPLPKESRLWDLPNVMITPHSTPKLPDRTQRSVDVILENLERFRRGEPLKNALTERDMFTKR